MSKKFIEHGDDFAVVIDKPTLKKLKIDKDSDVEMVIEDNVLIIRVCKQSEKKSQASSDEETDKIADRILEEYKSVFDRLSKS